MKANHIEAMKLALEALECTEYPQDHYDAITALREALAEQPAQQEPVLQDIEQYRLQMAGISTAAIGYWKEGDGILPDYDTIALRDVAKLYKKYDELYKAQNVPHGIIAGALFDFMGWLTTRPKRIMLSSVDDASPAADAIKDFAKMRGLSLDDAQVQNWQEALAEQPAQQQEPVAWICEGSSSDEKHAIDYWPRDVDDLPIGTKLYTSPPAQRTWIGLTPYEIQELHLKESHWGKFACAIEAKLKQKNTP